MPLYEYQCEKCGDVFEVMQKFADTPLSTHEKCGGPVHRLLSAPALQFKGSGWYVNDYAKSGSSSTNSGAGASKKDDSGTKTSSSDSSASSSSKSTSSDTKSSS